MGTLKKIQDFILPHEVDFFLRLQEQSSMAKNCIDELHAIYIERKGATNESLKNKIQLAQDMRRKNLQELYTIFITPVDKEAISRAYINLDWVVMSIEHLLVELEIYRIDDLSDYKIIFDLLKEEMKAIHFGFACLQKNDFENFSKGVFDIVHFDNELIREYAKQVSALLNQPDFKKIITGKEILTQLKEISKRIRICANDLEDMLFKMV